MGTLSMFMQYDGAFSRLSTPVPFLLMYVCALCMFVNVQEGVWSVNVGRGVRACARRPEECHT